MKNIVFIVLCISVVAINVQILFLTKDVDRLKERQEISDYEMEHKVLKEVIKKAYPFEPRQEPAKIVYHATNSLGHSAKVELKQGDEHYEQVAKLVRQIIDMQEKLDMQKEQGE